jgi:hypothetical protein
MDELITKLREKLASTSTETLKKYYRDLKYNIIPPSLSEFSEIGEDLIKKYIEKELILRGVIKKAKRVRIY